MLSFLSRENIPYLVVGKGSNLLVKDEGFKGVGIILAGNLAAIARNGDNDQLIQAGGGLSIGELLTHCGQQGLGGLEFLAGIPGTVGGAVAMNAGAFGKDTGSMVRQIQVVTHQGELATRSRSNLNFSYRELSTPVGTVIVNVWFKLNHERPEILSKRKEDCLARRKASQPLEYPSGGSVFKNPLNDYAGRLIERTGLKGRVIGGAMISPKHANFIVNTGGARAEDILALMELTREKVKEETGIELEPELRVVGI
jgi:UDP-N-acetylmuramate dehydrogenase